MANKHMKRDPFIWEMKMKTAVKTTWSPDGQKFKSPNYECWLRVWKLSYMAHENVELVTSL